MARDNELTRAPTVEEVEGSRVKYLKVSMRNGEKILVARPYVNGEWMPQHTYSMDQLTDAIAYVKKCMLLATRSGVGQHPKKSPPLRTLSYYLEEFLDQGKHSYGSATLWSYKTRFDIVGRVVLKQDLASVSGKSKEVLTDVAGDRFEGILARATSLEESLKGQSSGVKAKKISEFLSKETEATDDGYIPIRNVPINHLTHKILRDAVTLSSEYQSMRKTIVTLLSVLADFIVAEYPHTAQIVFGWKVKVLRKIFKYATLKTIEFYNEEERETIRNWALGSPDRWPLREASYGMLILIMNTGARISEVLALKREDYERMVSTGGNRILINKTISKSLKDTWELSTQTKTGTVREVMINEDARKWLDFFYNRIIKPENEFLIQPEAHSRYDFVTYNSMNGRLQKLCKVMGVRYLPSQEAGRKTMINMFVDNATNDGFTYEKALKTVGINVGHVNRSTTEKSYAKAKTLSQDEEKIIFNKMK
jgi:integrase